MKNVWFITGASKGLGLALVKRLLENGYCVAATSRSRSQLESAIGMAGNENFLALEADLLDEASIRKAVQDAESHFGRLDVIVNNAGYGIGGALEELSTAEIRQSFDVNVFATMTVMQAALPGMRARRSGKIFNIASIAGFIGATAWAVYSATKAAVIALSEVSALDLKELGIYVTAVAPGGFRTEFLSKESLVISERKIDAYEGVHASLARYETINGKQAGDPDKAAGMFIELAEMPEPPVRFFMGSDACKRAQEKIEALTEELETNKERSARTDVVE
jgi:NAD(P)-dependent dehydrogenase (short-subunit alcohol dehydrogenase family)